MQKLINGILYDTDKAEKLAEYNNGEEGESRNKQALYRGKNGHYFLVEAYPAEMVTAMLNFAFDKEDVAQMVSKLKSDIKPITEENAKNWVGRLLGIDEYRRIFGEPEEA